TGPANWFEFHDQAPVVGTAVWPIAGGLFGSRDIEASMSSHQARLHHAGGAAPARSTFADANRDRDCHSKCRGLVWVTSKSPVFEGAAPPKPLRQEPNYAASR
ncbi:MAG: hypothetical protein ACT4O2_05670, partial [Beijerinckiaceae bacterium]